MNKSNWEYIFKGMYVNDQPQQQILSEENIVKYILFEDFNHNSSQSDENHQKGEAALLDYFCNGGTNK